MMIIITNHNNNTNHHNNNKDNGPAHGLQVCKYFAKHTLLLVVEIPGLVLVSSISLLS